MAKEKIHVRKTKVKASTLSESTAFDSDINGSFSDGSQDRLSSSGSISQSEEDDGGQPKQEKSAMANVVARILSKDVSKSNRVLLAKGKTNKEILIDILERKRLREDAGKPSISKFKDSDVLKDKSGRYREEKKKIWESMARKLPSVLDNPKEMKLRKIATQGMVQLFRSVNEHQKVMNHKLSSVGSSERKREKVMSEFTKGRFLDLLKGGGRVKKTSKDNSEKWKILEDDYMMGAQMKDWDKEDDGGGSDDEAVGQNAEADDVLSDNEM